MAHTLFTIELVHLADEDVLTPCLGACDLDTWTNTVRTLSSLYILISCVHSNVRLQLRWAELRVHELDCTVENHVNVRKGLLGLVPERH